MTNNQASRDSYTKRGKAMTVRKFKEKYPDKKITKDMLTQKRKRDGTVVLLVKTYNDSSSEWSFSEADEEVVTHATTLDNGAIILDENQMRNTASGAIQKHLASGSGGVKAQPKIQKGGAGSGGVVGSGASGSRANKRNNMETPRKKVGH